MKRICFVLLVLFGATPFAQPPTTPKPVLSMQDVEKVRRLLNEKAVLEKALHDVNALEAAALAVGEEKRIECIGAFGHQAFCSCIADNVPIAMSFQLYVVLLSKGRESFGYPAQLSADDKSQMDVAYAAREKCVAEVFGPK